MALRCPSFSANSVAALTFVVGILSAVGCSDASMQSNGKNGKKTDPSLAEGQKISDSKNADGVDTAGGNKVPGEDKSDADSANGDVTPVNANADQELANRNAKELDRTIGANQIKCTKQAPPPGGWGNSGAEAQQFANCDLGTLALNFQYVICRSVDDALEDCDPFQSQSNGGKLSALDEATVQKHAAEINTFAVANHAQCLQFAKDVNDEKIQDDQIGCFRVVAVKK